MKVLDSTFLIDLLRGKKEALKYVEKEEMLLTTQINVYEILKGLHSQDVSEEKYLRVKEMFENIRVLQFDDNASLRAAEISSNLMKKGITVADCDCMIAGIALSKGAKIIVTRNVNDFSKIKEIKVETY
jgi:tRNA(fMet)-specific endonuclease VapC